MGCYPPLDRIVSKALGKCNGAYRAVCFTGRRSGRDRWREERLDYALAYPPGAPAEIHYVRPVARTVTFASNNSVYVIPPSPPPPQPQPQQQQSPPEPQQPQTPPQHEPEQHHDAPEPQPQPQPEEQPGHEPPAQTQDAPPPAAEPKPPKGPRRGKKKQSGRVRFGPAEPPPSQQQEEQPQQEEHAQGPGDSGNAPGQHGPPHGAAPAPPQGPGYLLRYTPSPLPRWEATPRRHEYFSGEYRSYYPTPVREGIYRIATDANRLTTIFSEENPNACTIV